MSQIAHSGNTRASARPTAAPPREEVAALYEQYRRRIREYCIGQLRDRQEADDAVQSTFMYAFTLLQRGTSPQRPLPWLYTIAHNVCRTRRRALKRRNRLESGVDLETIHDSVGRPDPSRDELAQLKSSLGALPHAQRDALLLREWHGLTYSEIAAHLSLSESAVEALLFRARRNLAQRLQHGLERVAIAFNGLFVLRVLRRFAPFASASRTTTTAAAIGAAAITTFTPALRPAPPVARTSESPPQSAVVHTAPFTASAVVRHATHPRVVHARPQVERSRAVATDVATTPASAVTIDPAAHPSAVDPPVTVDRSAAPPAASPPAPSPAAPAPAPAAQAEPATQTAPATPTDPGAPADPHPVADAVQDVAGAVQATATTIASSVPDPSDVAAPVVAKVDAAVSAVTSTVTSALPALTLPQAPPKAPLQGKP